MERVKAQKDPFTALQRLAIDKYEKGDFAHIKTRRDLKNCGDGLLPFLVTELSEKEGCEDIVTAINRLDTISTQIDELKYAYLAAHQEEG